MSDLRSSAEWCDLFGCVVVDPDGWDRGNLEESWAEEISVWEFSRRLSESTIDLLGKEPAASSDPVIVESGAEAVLLTSMFKGDYSVVVADKKENFRMAKLLKGLGLRK